MSALTTPISYDLRTGNYRAADIAVQIVDLAAVRGRLEVCCRLDP